MNRVSFIALWGLTVFLGFAIGMAIGGSKEPRLQARHPRQAAAEKSEADRALAASLQRFQKTLAEKENLAASLRAEMEEVRGKLLPPLGAEDEKWLREREEEDSTTKRWGAIVPREKELLRKILQRKDKVLRAKGFDELASLLESEKAEDKLVGIITLNHVLYEGLGFDKERFEPLVEAALRHEDWEVRERALDYVRGLGWMDLGRWQVTAEVALRMVRDPHPRVKSEALGLLAQFGGSERSEDVAGALRSLLASGTEESVSTALWATGELAQDRSAYGFPPAGDQVLPAPEKRYDYYPEMRELMMKASKNPDLADDVLKFWWGRQSLNEEEVRRAAEILEGTGPDGYVSLPEYAPTSAELRQLAYSHEFRVIRESVVDWIRSGALWRLERSGDKSLIPQLRALAASEDAEGLERRIEWAIERLERYGRQRD